MPEPRPRSEIDSSTQAKAKGPDTAQPDLELTPLSMAKEPEGGLLSLERWCSGDRVWGIALAIGFAASWLGMLSAPSLAALGACGLFFPLYLGLLRRGERFLMWVASLAWALGIVAAILGHGHELKDPFSWRHEVPGAQAIFASDFAFLTDSASEAAPGEKTGGEASTGWHNLGRDLSLLALTLLLARPLGGALALFLVALLLGAVSGALGSAGFHPATSGLDVLAAFPLHTSLYALAALSGIAALSEPGAFPRTGPLGETQKRLFLAFLGLGGLAASAQGPFVEAWRGLLRASLAG